MNNYWQVAADFIKCSIVALAYNVKNKNSKRYERQIKRYERQTYDYKR